MGTLNGESLFAMATSSLTSTYSVLSQYSKTAGSLSLSDITNPSSTAMSQLGSNSSFLSYLSTNFTKLDADGDGKITSTDINNYTTKMQTQGLTRDEITQLCASGNSTLASTVLNYFSKIDKNGDGKVTSAEISAFGYEAEEQKMDTKYRSFKPSSISTFYVDSADDGEPSSVIDAMYPSDDKMS